MLKELIRHLGGTQPRFRNPDGPSTTGGKACGDVPAASGGLREGNVERLENGPRRNWRPRLYW